MTTTFLLLLKLLDLIWNNCANCVSSTIIPSIGSIIHTTDSEIHNFEVTKTLLKVQT